MKTTNKFALLVGLSSLAAFPVLAEPPVVTVQVPAPPSVTIAAPAPPAVVVAPAVTVETTVPDTYVYDGDEYVGVIGTQYYYLGPDKVWLPFDSVREARFHTWESAHADWRAHAIRNELYRHDAHGHEFPQHDEHRDVNHDDHAHNHDAGHDRDHDHH
ncbi:MAG TPA: hypothetical protein VG347_14085 [Verrucomicrobiae bacterium]|nr:hypothetical protein [Verrucomicrobiae bacterium]